MRSATCGCGMGWVTGSGPDGGRVLGWVGTDGSWVSLARGFVLRRARFVLGASAAIHWHLGAGSWGPEAEERPGGQPSGVSRGCGAGDAL